MASRPLRLAAHNGGRSYGGGEKWTALLLRALQERGHVVRLFCNQGLVAEAARAEGVDAVVGRLGGQAMLPHAWRLASALREWRPDALLLSTFRKTWLGGMAGRMARVPRVVARIGLDTDLPGRHWTYRWAFPRWMDAVLCNADGIRAGVLASLPTLDPAAVATVFDGVRLSVPVPGRDEARRELGLPVDAPVVGAVARLAGQKRLDRMLETVALLPGVHAVLAGGGEEEAALRRRAAALGLTSRVHFLGYRRDVETVLGALDLFLVTSDREGMANAMLEAMAAGVPVLSTPVSGADEALAGDAGGRAPGLVVPADPARLAEAASGILALPAVRLAMGEEGRRRAAERFSFPAMVDAWEGVLAGDPPARWHQGP